MNFYYYFQWNSRFSKRVKNLKNIRNEICSDSHTLDRQQLKHPLPDLKLPCLVTQLLREMGQHFLFDQPKNLVTLSSLLKSKKFP